MAATYQVTSPESFTFKQPQAGFHLEKFSLGVEAHVDVSVSHIRGL